MTTVMRRKKLSFLLSDQVRSTEICSDATCKNANEFEYNFGTVSIAELIVR